MPHQEFSGLPFYNQRTSGEAGVPTLAQLDQQHLCITRTQAPSLARHSGLKTSRCCRCSLCCNCCLDLIPGQGTPQAMGQPNNNNNDNNNDNSSSSSKGGRGEDYLVLDSFFLCVCFLGPHLQHMEVSRLGVQLEL